MKRTRKWSFVAQEAARFAALGLPPREIARRLGVNKSTVTRWVKSGKITLAERPPGVTGEGLTPEAWAKAVREAYDLDVTDDQLVNLGQAALELSQDQTASPNVRLQAAGRFQALVRQLQLVARIGQREDDEEDEAPAAPKRAVPVRATPGEDPRRLLQAVK